MLYASSGSVYGRQPGTVDQLGEDSHTDAITVSPYGQLKRRTEALLLASGCDCVFARGFAFIGPYLPLTDKFAAGSFLRDALAGGPIRIHGDGSQVRSYLYAADLAVWLLTLLARGTPGRAYNIGSDVAVSLRELANLVAAALPHPCAVVEGGSPVSGAERYVPDIAQARSEIGLDVAIGLDSAVSRSVSAALAAGLGVNRPIAQESLACIR